MRSFKTFMCLYCESKENRYVYSNNNNKANFSTKRQSSCIVKDERIGNVVCTVTTIRQISLQRDNQVIW